MNIYFLFSAFSSEPTSSLEFSENAVFFFAAAFFTQQINTSNIDQKVMCYIRHYSFLIE